MYQDAECGVTCMNVSYVKSQKHAVNVFKLIPIEYMYHGTVIHKNTFNRYH